MKKALLMLLCILAVLSLTACSGTDDRSHGSESVDTALHAMEEEAVPAREGFCLAVNEVEYSIPISLKQLMEEGWRISDQTPYFLTPLTGEAYYEARMNLSLSEDGEGIFSGGSIIRLLEKDGVLLEVTIANQAVEEAARSVRKIEDGVVDSMTVFYDEAHTSIQLNGRELSTLTPELLQEEYPTEEGWVHSPSNLSNHPEFGISTLYEFSNDLDDCDRSISIYFDLEQRAFKITVCNQTRLS